MPGPNPPSRTTKRRQLRLVMLVLGGILLVLVMRQVLNPFGDREYAEIPHGNHSHFVPKDRDPNVPIDRFPTRPPNADERILPDGRIVPR